MSVRMENVAARKINYKMMVSTFAYATTLCVCMCVRARIRVPPFALSLFVFLDGRDGGCAVRAQLAAYFAQPRPFVRASAC